MNDPIDAYDSKHGKPEKTPDYAPTGKPNSGGVPSEADAWGTGLNPVRETPLAGKGLKSVG